MDAGADTSIAREAFRSLLLRHRGRTGLIQRDLAARAGIGVRSVQDWEAGATLPTAERLRALIRVLFETGGLTAGQEAREARELWAAAEREASRMRTPFDEEWLAELIAAREATTGSLVSEPVETTEHRTESAERRQEWGEAPDSSEFTGITSAQHAALLALGGLERQDTAS